MWTPVKNGYGYGWTLEPRFEHKCQSHGGGIPGFRTMIARFPDDKICIIILSNLEGTPVGDISKDLSAICFGEKYDLPKATAAKANAAPKGFIALFNGKDLTGWHGMPHFDPYKLAAMPEEDRKTQIAEMDRRRQEALDGRERRAGQRRQGRLPDDRQGLRRHRAAHRIQDGAQGRQRHLSPRHAAGADLGLHQGRRQVEPRRRQGQRRPVEQQPRARPARTRSSWPTSRSASGTASASSRSASASRSISTTSWSSITPGWRTTGTASCRCLQAGADPAADARRRDPLAQHLRPRDPARRGQRDPPQAQRRRASRTSSTARTSPAGPGPLENYEVKDGAIVCKPNKGGNIYTKEEYGDFVARVEFRLPPGGNNGLAIRYPGKGDSRL